MLAIAAVAAFPFEAAGDVVFSQPVSAAAVDGIVSVADFQHVADDFAITGGASIASVRWWGFTQVFGGSNSSLSGFRVQILDASGVDEGPGSVLAEWNPAIDGVTQTPTGVTIGFSQEARYDFDLPAAFVAAPATRYWLLIAGAINDGTSFWNWRPSTAGNAVYAVGLTFGPGWQTNGGQVNDWAFELRSIPSPSATTACGVLALLCTSRRRR